MHVTYIITWVGVQCGEVLYECVLSQAKIL